MKKILLLLIFVCFNMTIFAESFFAKHRFLELKAGTDVNFSNNLLAANDFMKKDLVIDLRKIAEDCPDEGFTVLAKMSPSVEMNLNIKSLGFDFLKDLI